ncbi:single-stranded-DNA-specific exonuclease RecJ [Salisediminibacterium selenitireducens]|uniref:Single-stranded-DNA-specific exonuclease RecJ n=1 Tax=Bacillus selenitireducens (strain ATCC 700615 / DSM 15326 / MLS10) TaxID=439292 RepID=D6XWY6_BACIE|nr:single-stranded-DNA-specific exonuclease RecJ [Salisediminibacterium selenitireducens]ADH99962.1 single-stranded-DNA-specific exonuclease RecJ [[Bacillus] selenitireducens MLS10]
MLPSKSKWLVPDWSEDQVGELAEATGLSNIAARFFVQRRKTTKEEVMSFLHMDHRSLLDPFLLYDMDRAVDRIRRAIEKQERILIFGDYDADGVTSTAITYLTLKRLGAEVSYYIPNRFTEGYGPNEGAFRQAAEESVSLIITVDTGISGVHEAEVAKECGMDLIITDHHEPPPVLPDAFAVVNPKQEHCSYPNPNLAGAGVAFKLAHALTGEIPEDLFDLVAIGTIADLVSLEGENRYLAKAGIEAIRQGPRAGVKALLDIAGAEVSELNEETIGFMIGPRLNAAGRLDSADPAAALLITENPHEAKDLAELIDGLNKERQSIVKEIAEEAIEQVEAQGVPSVIIVGAEGWNPGVIGIVASRLVERYYRPVIVLSFDQEKEQAKGSARSIEGFDMFQSLSTCRDILPHFGGHPMAAGLTMSLSDVEELRERLIRLANESMSDDDWIRKLKVDLPVSIEEVTLNAIEDLQAMAPYGIGNPAPKVMLEDVGIVSMRRIGATGDHLKLSVNNKGSGIELDAIAFGKGDAADEISKLSPLSLVGKLGINEWNGKRKPQFLVEDMQISDWQLFDFRGNTKFARQQHLLNRSEVTAVTFSHPFSAIRTEIPEEWIKVEVIDGFTDDQRAIIQKAGDVVFIDLPKTLEQMERLVQELKNLEKLYPVFLQADSGKIETVPRREQFSELYKLFIQQEKVDMKRHAHTISRKKGWSMDHIRFMCKVFSELEFVTMKDGIVEVVSNPEKKQLNDSALYQETLAKQEVEQALYYSSSGELKRWVEQRKNPAAVPEA